MDIDHEAPIVVTGSVDVSAPPQDVWAVLSDIRGWPGWFPDVREARVEGELTTGSRFLWRTGWTTITSVLGAVRPGRELAWAGTTGGVHVVHVWRIEPAAGGSRVTTEESWSGWPTHLLHGRREETLRKSVFRSLHSLKAEVEFRLRKESRLVA